MTSATLLRVISVRSAETSKVSPAPRCTPPIPPVAKTGIPAIAAIRIVAATVVAPSKPRPTTNGKSRTETFMISGPDWPNISISSADNPAFNLPPITAMVAGTAPWARTTCSTAIAVSTFAG